MSHRVLKSRRRLQTRGAESKKLSSSRESWHRRENRECPGRYQKRFLLSSRQSCEINLYRCVCPTRSAWSSKRSYTIDIAGRQGGDAPFWPRVRRPRRFRSGWRKISWVLFLFGEVTSTIRTPSQRRIKKSKGERGTHTMSAETTSKNKEVGGEGLPSLPW